MARQSKATKIHLGLGSCCGLIGKHLFTFSVLPGVQFLATVLYMYIYHLSWLAPDHFLNVSKQGITQKPSLPVSSWLGIQTLDHSVVVRGNGD